VVNVNENDFQSDLKQI